MIERYVNLIMFDPDTYDKMIVTAQKRAHTRGIRVMFEVCLAALHSRYKVGELTSGEYEAMLIILREARDKSFEDVEDTYSGGAL